MAFEATLETLTHGGSLLAALAFGIMTASTAAALSAGRAISRPIHALTVSMTALASGDFAADIPDLTRRDEVGAMAKALAVLKQSGIERARLEEERAVASERVRTRTHALETMSLEFRSRIADVLTRLGTTVNHLAAMAQALRDSADRTTQQVEKSLRGAAIASENVNAVAAASEQMSGAAVQMTQRAQQSRGFIQGAAAEVGQTRTLVENLVSASDRISKIVGFIFTIAKKTNLLALNASIEAARAGETGKGFAVVAGEVKALANQAEHATDEIGQQVDTVQQVARATAEAIASISEIICAVDEHSQRIVAVITDQRLVIQGVSGNATEAACGTDAVVRGAQDILDLASNTNKRSAELAEMVQELEHEVEGIRSCIGNFLDTMQAIA
ncbi:MAG: methyl-accepting chemotaxis protein [Magnetospirillum sp.]|nr:methyl-accepting chemotaxis protein [Magnetospirillum sp.]